MLIVEKQKVSARENLVIDGRPLAVTQAQAIGNAECHLQLSDDAQQLARIGKSAGLVDQAVEEGWPIYGVTTGFGGMSEVPVPNEMAWELQNNLLSFLATAAGNPIERCHVRLAMALRANVLFQGCSGVRLEIIERLIRFVNADATPVVRELGSIGASGDLVPLSAIARAITGESERVRVQLGDREVDGPTALQELGLTPLRLRPKEGLAIVNGTSFSSAIAANCVAESRKLFALAIASQAMMLESLQVHLQPFEDFVHRKKPHPGQVWTARLMVELLRADHASNNGSTERNGKNRRIQDQYSLRCLPQYTGPIAEGMKRVIDVVETEMNSVSDNPLIDACDERFYQSGNFLGQYLGIAMDDLRRFLGLLAKHLDVQIASLVSPAFSNGLPPSLRGNDQLPYNMGLKGLQITGNSIMPMLTYLGNPVVEHFPTHAEQFNQNINGLSWGSANLAWKSIELFRHYLCVSLLFSLQALDLQAKKSLGHYNGHALLGTTLGSLYEALVAELDLTTSRDRPYVFDDKDQWLEDHLSRLNAALCEESAVLTAVSPILESFDQFQGEA